MKKKTKEILDATFDIAMLAAGVLICHYEGIISCMAFFGVLVYLKLCEISTAIQAHITRLKNDEKAR